MSCGGGLIAEAHPEVIGEGGVATEEAYQKDLAYLKQKVVFSHKHYLYGICTQSHFLADAAHSVCRITFKVMSSAFD